MSYFKRYAIKVKEKGSSRYKFIRPNGGLTTKRIHAALAAGKEAAEEYAKGIKESNPDVVEDVKVVSFDYE